jgi:HK97 family phage major capsid protein
MPVQRQQIEDWAQLRSLIDTRLRYSVQRREEEQLIFGDGNAPNLEGLAVVSGTQDIASNGRFDPTASPGAAHTLIDAVRMGITDVRVAGGAYEPNALIIHPYDWETILIEKGTDQRYVWAVVPDSNGDRIWGVRAVEAVGAQHRTTQRRVFILGDFQVGAQLLDRMQLTVQVGLIDRQFVENMMTILAESRVAFPIYAPAAFALFETQEAQS